MLSEVARLLTLYLCIPVVACTTERSFFIFAETENVFEEHTVVKRLNNVAVLHVNKDLSYNIDLHEFCNDFIRRNGMREKKFPT